MFNLLYIRGVFMYSHKTFFLSLLLLFSSSALAMDKAMEQAEPFKTNGAQFTVFTKDGHAKPVKPYDVDKTLRKAPPKTLPTLLKNGYIQPQQLDNGDYKLKFNVRGKGGGPLTAGLFYWATKGICYGSAAGAATAAASSIFGATVGGVIVHVAETAGNVAGGTSLVSGFVSQIPWLAEASAYATGAVTSGGTFGYVVACVESGASAAGAIGMALPTP